jgi:hypothetical protein
VTSKSLKEKAIDIKGKKYVLVSDRVQYFNETYPNGSINTELVSDPTSDYIIVKATVIPDCDKPERKFSDYSQAVIGEGMVNKTAALENASTSATGRALGFMGIGVIESIASADEMTKAKINGTPRTNKGATEKQIAWLRSEASQVTGLEHAEDIDKWIEEVLTVKPTQIPVFKVKDAVDRIKQVGKEAADKQPEIDTSEINIDLDEDISKLMDKIPTRRIYGLININCRNISWNICSNIYCLLNSCDYRK